MYILLFTFSLSFPYLNTTLDNLPGRLQVDPGII